MVTVTLEYKNSNAVLNGILDAVAKMPDVKIRRTQVPSKVKKVAKILNQSINPNAPTMTMEEIVQEIRDYRCHTRECGLLSNWRQGSLKN